MAEKRPTFSQVVDRAPDAVRPSDLSYVPSDHERQLKAHFWAAMEDNPVCDYDAVTAAAVEQLTNDSRIHRLWSKPGFRGWFLNKVEVAAKAEYTLDMLLDSFIDIARSDDPKSFGAKVAAAKLLADMRGYTRKAEKARPLDAEIPTDPIQLAAYIKKIQAQLEPKAK